MVMYPFISIENTLPRVLHILYYGLKDNVEEKYLKPGDTFMSTKIRHEMDNYILLMIDGTEKSS